MSNQITVTGNITATYGVQQVNVTITIASPLGLVTGVALASGANTISIPAGTSLILIQLPVGNTQTVTLKGVTGDTGILLLRTGVNIIQPDPTDTSFVLTAGSAIAALTVITFL